MHACRGGSPGPLASAVDSGQHQAPMEGPSTPARQGELARHPALSRGAVAKAWQGSPCSSDPSWAGSSLGLTRPLLGRHPGREGRCSRGRRHYFPPGAHDAAHVPRPVSHLFSPFAQQARELLIKPTCAGSGTRGGGGVASCVLGL